MGVVGNVPLDGVVVSENRGWSLFLQPSSGCGWLPLKLVSKVPRKKANYWLAWSPTKRRLAAGKDAGLLDRTAPEVFDWVVAVASGMA